MKMRKTLLIKAASFVFLSSLINQGHAENSVAPAKATEAIKVSEKQNQANQALETWMNHALKGDYESALKLTSDPLFFGEYQKGIRKYKFTKIPNGVVTRDQMIDSFTGKFEYFSNKGFNTAKYLERGAVKAFSVDLAAILPNGGYIISPKHADKKDISMVLHFILSPEGKVVAMISHDL